jgi:hypothetical protein
MGGFGRGFIGPQGPIQFNDEEHPGPSFLVPMLYKPFAAVFTGSQTAYFIKPFTATLTMSNPATVFLLGLDEVNTWYVVDLSDTPGPSGSNLSINGTQAPSGETPTAPSAIYLNLRNTAGATVVQLTGTATGVASAQFQFTAAIMAQMAVGFYTSDVQLVYADGSTLDLPAIPVLASVMP